MIIPCVGCVQLDIFLNFLTGVMTFNKETGLIETSYDLVDVAGTYAR